MRRRLTSGLEFVLHQHLHETVAGVALLVGQADGAHVGFHVVHAQDHGYRLAGIGAAKFDLIEKPVVRLAGVGFQAAGLEAHGRAVVL